MFAAAVVWEYPFRGYWFLFRGYFRTFRPTKPTCSRGSDTMGLGVPVDLEVCLLRFIGLTRKRREGILTQ